MIVARRFIVSGRVQGVGFRFFAEDQARAEGLSGYVRNLPDGRVEVLAEGEEESVARFERALNRGPRSAIVDRVDVDPVPPEDRRGFSIRF
ncbi:MAG TPA: acylphosphatase [Vicinamibacterales bacterium]|nr:acylphosphatase [Vicinamibacterales bacterium]